MSIDWDDFEKLDIRVGTILCVHDFERAKKPAFQLEIDFGEKIGIKKSSAQITIHYSKHDLFNRQVIAVINFEPKNIAGFMSECLVLGIYDENKDVILLKPDKATANGLKIG